MYLIINEECAVRKSIAYTTGDLCGCDDACLEIIDISNPEKPVSYYHGKWDVVLDVGEEYE